MQNYKGDSDLGNEANADMIIDSFVIAMVIHKSDPSRWRNNHILAQRLGKCFVAEYPERSTVG